MEKITKEEYMLRKFLGMVGRMRKHQKAYFKNGKMPADLRQSKEYEAKSDAYISHILHEGYKPIFEDDKQGKLL